MSNNEYVWASRSAEWRKDNPGKSYMYKKFHNENDEIHASDLTSNVKSEVKFKPNHKEIAGVYVFICEQEKHVYVGQSKNVDNRLRNHKMNIVSDKPNYSQMYGKVKEHYKKHGIDSFVFKPHTYCLSSSEELLRVENHVMQQYIREGYTLYNRSISISIRENEIYCDPEYRSIVMDVISKIKDKKFLAKLKSIL